MVVNGEKDTRGLCTGLYGLDTVVQRRDARDGVRSVSALECVRPARGRSVWRCEGDVSDALCRTQIISPRVTSFVERRTRKRPKDVHRMESVHSQT